MYNIITKFSMTGEHFWPNAPEEYSQLRSKHYHDFTFECHIPVETSRQLEFLGVRKTLMRSLGSLFTRRDNFFYDFGDSSCEDLCDILADIIEKEYQLSPCLVIVMEDKTVGAELV